MLDEMKRGLETTVFLGNDLFSWVLALGLACVAYLALSLVTRMTTKYVKRLSEKTATIVDDLFAAALDSTRRLVLLVVAISVGTLFLELGRAEGVISFLLVVAVTVQVALWLNRIISEYLVIYTNARKESNPGSISAIQAVSFVIRVLVWSLALLLIIDNRGYDVTALIAGLGVGGIAVALAVQNILGDLFASLSIVLDKPFVVGDFIIVGDLLGVVERIGIKTTRVKSLSGEQLVFSNSDLLSSRIRNFKRMYERRVAFEFGVIYQTTPDELESIPPKIREIISGIENSRFDRAHFKAFGESSFDFEVVYYVLSPDYNIYMDIQQAINLAIYRDFEARGIEFAYPTRTLYIGRGEQGEKSDKDEQAVPGVS